MRKTIFSIACVLFSMTAAAQVRVAEPETAGNFFLLTSDSTSTPIPMKMGIIGEHQTIHQSIFGSSGGKRTGSTTELEEPSNDMDIVIGIEEEPLSHYMTKGEMRIIVKVEDYCGNPTEEFRIIRLQKHPKELRFHLKKAEEGQSDAKTTQNLGFIKFSATKYGEGSYILSVPIKEIRSGFYGVFRRSSFSKDGIPMGTFYLKIYKHSYVI